MKKAIKKRLAKNDVAFKIIMGLNNYLKGIYYWDFDVLAAYVMYKKDVKFVQIGSNDGVNGDPIHDYIKKYRWHGVLVEPVPYIFENLVANYKDYEDVLFFENSAIASENGRLKFYRLQKSDLPDLPEWYDQLGSFNKEVVLKHKDRLPHFDELFFEDTVNSITFSTLTQKYAIQDLNLVHIDTEGYDYEVLKIIPFADFNIDFLMFEHKHLSRSDYKEAKKLLQSYGYKCGLKGADTIAVKKHLVPILIKANKKN